MSLSGLQKHPRYPLTAPVDVVTTTAEILVLAAVNISYGGIFIHTTTPPPMGSEIRLRLRSEIGPLGLFGRVVHVIDEASAARKGHPPGMGVQFESLPTPTTEILHRLVDGLAAAADQRKQRQAAVVFIDAVTVSVKPQRAVLQKIWEESLKHGGLYAAGGAAVVLGAVVKVIIGPLELAAEVVHVEPSRGAGLQLKDLVGPKREALTRFLEGNDESLLYQEVKNVGAPLAKLLADVRRLLAGVEGNDPWGALGLTPGSSEGEVRGRLADLKTAFAAPPDDATPPQIARLQQASVALARFAPVALKAATTPLPLPSVSLPVSPVSALPMPTLSRARTSMDSVADLLAEAASLERKGDPTGARRALANAVELAPDHPEVLKRLAAHDDAAALARAADLIKNAEVFVQGVGMKDQAISHAREALKLTGVRELRLRAVRVLAKAGEYLDAIFVAEDLLAVDRHDLLALTALLHLYEKTEQWISAVQTGEALLRLKPDDGDLAKKVKGIVEQARKPSASRSFRAPSRTDLRPASRTDLRPPSRTDMRPPSRTDIRPPSRTGGAPPREAPAPLPSWADLLPGGKKSEG
ncbi:MAG: PilZ domain-containing protein [Deltaproteobacteria bacterium]|nr:PilZ domain-containing protein [Deltaproteobacteria bacterium]